MHSFNILISFFFRESPKPHTKWCAKVKNLIVLMLLEGKHHTKILKN